MFCLADFKVVSKFEPMGDQISAIDTLSEGIINGKKHQTLMGVTGSGKTFTIAKVERHIPLKSRPPIKKADFSL